MNFSKIKSNAKINLALNIIGKSNGLHEIESLIAFIDLHDVILLKKIKSKKHHIIFRGKFSKNINSNNTISKLLKILEKKKILKQKFYIKITKNIPQKAGLGGGSMNAARILKYLIEKKIIKVNRKQISEITSYIGSDVILGLNPINSILTSKNKIKKFRDCKRLYTLIVKPSYGCSTKYIYSLVKKFDKAKFNKPTKKMFNPNFLKRMSNSLEKIAFKRYSSLKKIKEYLINLQNPIFVRMTGSGSALVSYYYSKKQCDKAQKKFIKDYKKYWCINSKTI
jgi:4-diphosphocytidyl-2-C-methyl-D-erythritol kinase